MIGGADKNLDSTCTQFSLGSLSLSILHRNAKQGGDFRSLFGVYYLFRIFAKLSIDLP